ILLGFAGYVLSQIPSLLRDDTIRLYGRVREAADARLSVPNSTVFIQLDTVNKVGTDANGDYSYVVPRGFANHTVQVWVQAPDYVPSEVRTIVLSPTMDRQDFGLQRIQAGSKVPASCLTGKWVERPSGAAVWTMVFDGSRIQLRRGDGWAEGVFTPREFDLIGDLHWGNGAHWTGMILSPNPNCTKVMTNKDWWYEKSPE